MGSTTSLPTLGRGNPHSNYTAAKRSASSAGTDKQHRKQQSSSSNGANSLARSKSCSNANFGKQQKQHLLQQQQQQNGGLESTVEPATNGSQWHKVSNGNYAPEPEKTLASTTSLQKQKQQQRLKNLQRPPANGGLVGLNNLGNTCYMNSILQCLSHTEPLLRHFVLERRFQPSAGRNGSGLAKAYANLMLRMWAASASPTGADCTSPTELKQCVAQYAPRFRGYSQQDAQEFLRYLLEGLHEDLNLVSVRPKLPPVDYEHLDLLLDDDKADELWQRYLQQENSPVVEAFVGQLKSTLECCHCSHKSVTFDPFWDLALPIPGKSRTSLDACLKLFTNQETLDGNERPTCDRCRCRRKCVKRFHLYRLPSVLVIHLMRFSGERFKTKLNTLVEYPMELDVSEFLDKKCRLRQTPQYRLYAVSEHAGTPYGGHYTAVVRHAGTGRWLRYNDNRVEEASTRSVVSTEGYVLFYSRVDSQPAEDVGDDDNEGDDPVCENGEDEENTEKHVMANGNH
ncbi:hypothetical protein BOX15_Mlig031886g1 [Macrostomum lignano]|uniref:Ubiquitin carboxyl-terminal hydrolase n=1 Tax=Macrostomum lignano TaxID=282301 RepID=A0A267EVZ9_9PLAT|nr:hypothetical protein BOX15_Mlig031886g1 [Macrostomum lignano]